MRFSTAMTMKLFNDMARTAAIAAAVLFLLAATCQAGEHQNHGDIKKAAELFLRQHLSQADVNKFEIHVHSMDRRLTLNQCDTPLEAFLPPGAKLHGKTTVGVRCNGPKPWKIFVPVKLAVYKSVVAVSRTIVKGEVLGPGDLTPVTKEISLAGQSFFRQPEQAVGFIAKRSIPEGKILTAHMVYAPRLVHRGQEVILLAETPQLEVRMKGKALSDGAKGDVIQVRNVRTKRVVEGVVTEAGVVRVNM
jgi:flagella basal body P-ring formation protein FlgA